MSVQQSSAQPLALLQETTTHAGTQPLASNQVVLLGCEGTDACCLLLLRGSTRAATPCPAAAALLNSCSHLFSVVQHHADGSHGGAPHERKHLPVHRRRACGPQKLRPADQDSEPAAAGLQRSTFACSPGVR